MLTRDRWGDFAQWSMALTHVKPAPWFVEARQILERHFIEPGYGAETVGRLIESHSPGTAPSAEVVTRVMQRFREVLFPS